MSLHCLSLFLFLLTVLSLRIIIRWNISQSLVKSGRGRLDTEDSASSGSGGEGRNILSAVLHCESWLIQVQQQQHELGTVEMRAGADDGRRPPNVNSHLILDMLVWESSLHEK
ncbi:hypothetical protein TB2_014304 [Malus domestica]